MSGSIGCVVEEISGLVLPLLWRSADFFSGGHNGCWESRARSGVREACEKMQSHSK